MKRLKGNNRGLSLIEVMVAVIILAIVVTPFLHSFTTTANTNRKAKETHRATVLAQSILENCKAETLEDLALQFDYPNNTDMGFRVVNSSRINGGTDWADYVKEYIKVSAYTPVVKYEDLTSYPTPEEKRPHITASTYSETTTPAEGDTEFLGQSGGTYYFAIGNVKEDRATYDVLVKLYAADYRTNGEHTKDPDTDIVVKPEVAYNATELAKIPVIDPKKDALCVQLDEYTERAVSDFYATFQSAIEPDIRTANPSDTPAQILEKVRAEIRENLTRTITLKVTKTAMGACVNAEYKYTYSHLLGGVTETRDYVKDVLVFDSALTGEKLRSVYLYYFPLYGKAPLYNDRTMMDDQIIIENEDSVPIDLYLFKQTKTGADAPTNTAEVNYKMALNVMESAAGIDVANMSTRLHTNLGINLTIPDSTINGYFLDSPPTVYLNNSDVTSEILFKEILSKEAENRVFDIEVMVYQKDGQENGYPEDMKLATIEGTKLK